MGKLLARGMMPQDLKMQCSNRVLSLLVAAALLTGGSPFSAQAKSYSSGSGRSYSSSSSRSSASSSRSSSSSSRSSSSGSGKSFSSGSSGSSSSRSSSSGSSSGGSKSSSSPSSSKNFSSGSGKSYSSGSSWSGNDRRGYSSTKSYSAGSGSKSQGFSSSTPSGSKSTSQNSRQSASSGSGFTFDTAAARARKEEASKQDFTTFKESQSPRTVTPGSPPSEYSPPVSGAGSYQAKPPPLPRRDYSPPPTYVPTTVIIQTRPRRVYDMFGPYSYRPWVTYSDPYSSLFWWWLLDRSIEDQARWAYHHRYDMDPARYQALLANNQQLEARVAQLESEQPPRDQTYTPTGLDRDLMYSDQYVNRTYSNRPTTGGRIAFWIFAVPAATGACVFFIWLIWFKRWQTA